MQILVRHIPTLLIGTLLGALIALGTSVFANREQGEEVKPIPYEDLRVFTEVFHRIKHDYVEDIDDHTLLENAIEGMLSGLDPHSSYLNPDEYMEIQTSTSGEFGGLGIEVGMEDGFVKVIAPIDDTPAKKAGVKSGDMIIRLDDTPVKGMTLMEAVKIMRGKPGTAITLTVVREQVDKPLKITITRDIIQIKSVKSRMLEPGYGYIRISHFQAHTEEDLMKTLEELRTEGEGKLNGLILDLRNNPGGVLNGAVAVSDAFLNKGNTIVYTEGRIEESSLHFNARSPDLLRGAPIVVLVNGGSASASEIVAGALQDHRRAIIMGNQTFGKGSVQTIVPIKSDAALKLTTARYYTPSGRSIQAEGIKPDITLSRVQISEAEELDDGPKEADLARHLQNDKPEEEKTEAEKQAEMEELVKSDYALYEALNLLKGLNIIERRS